MKKHTVPVKGVLEALKKDVVIVSSQNKDMGKKLISFTPGISQFMVSSCVAEESPTLWSTRVFSTVTEAVEYYNNIGV